jgi:hypothetical protein
MVFVTETLDQGDQFIHPSFELFEIVTLHAHTLSEVGTILIIGLSRERVNVAAPPTTMR